MKNLSELKRTVVPGSKLVMTRHDWFPNGQLIGVERSVSRVQGNAIVFLHPETQKESWLYLDSAKNFIFDGTDTFSVILNPDAEGYKPLMTYKLVH